MNFHEKINRKHSRGYAFRNICTKFGADWNILGHRNDNKIEMVAESHNDTVIESQTHELLVISSFRIWESPKQNVSAQSE